MSYDPFGRGQHPVGVRTARLPGSAGARPLLAELWYPASSRYTDRDLDPITRDSYELLPGMPRVPQDAVRDAVAAEGCWPLIAFSHGFGGHRRQSTFLCTHLASHGYVVAAVDHAGNTMLDVYRQAMAMRTAGGSPDVAGILDEQMRVRPSDVRALVRAVTDDTAGAMASRIDVSRLGLAGHSFGGWTALTATACEERVGATLALAPAGGRGPGLPNVLADGVDLAWRRAVPVLFIVADEDSVLPLPSMHELYERVPSPKRFASITRADHMHFCDRAAEVHEIFRATPPPGPLESAARRARPFSELRAASEAYDTIRGLGLAHFDATLKRHAPASTFLTAHTEP